jgi:hypothetical protein
MGTPNFSSSHKNQEKPFQSLGMESLNAQVSAVLEPSAGEAVAEVREYSPEDLETENFRIPSTTWVEKTDRNGVRYLQNPEGDVTELIEGPYTGEQYFQNNGAMERELVKAGKRTMSPQEWNSFAERYKDWIFTNLPLAGYFYEFPFATHDSQGSNGLYWASSPESCGCNVNFSSTQVLPVNYNLRTNGFSVRCLKN